MATIREYQSSVGTVGPGQTINIPLSIADAAGAQGRVLEKAAGAAVNVVNSVAEQLDKARVAKDLAEARADLTTQLHADVESGVAATPDFAEKVQERTSKRLEAVQKGYHTLAGATSSQIGSANLISEFRVQANHYQSVAVGQHAALAFQQALDAHTSTLLKDPQQFGSVAAELSAQISDPTGLYAGKIPAQKLNELKYKAIQDLSFATVRGAIRTAGPDVGRQMLEDKNGPGGALSGQMVAQLQGEADTQDRLNAERDNQRRIFEERKIRLVEEGIELNFVNLLHAKGGSTLTVDAIADANLSAAKKNEWIARLKEGARAGNPLVTLEAFERIHLPDGDPHKIVNESQLYDYVRAGGVDLTSLNSLRNELKHDPLGESLNLATQSAAAAFSRSMIGQLYPEKAAEATFRWRQDLSAKVEKYRKDFKDPRSLVTPGSEDYVLSPERIKAYMPLGAGGAGATASDVAAQKQQFEAATAEIAKGGGNLPRVGTIAEVQKLPSGSYFYNNNTGKLGYKP